MIKVFLLCYNRNEMLPRAVHSLLNQSYRNWSCELHCDKPDNTYPRELVEQLNDSRIRLVQHEKNLGLTQAFNIPFQPTDAKYISILEEDNWWEPNFLQEMLAFMEAHTEVPMAWANMRLWNYENHQWIDTYKNIWTLNDSANRKFEFPHIQQMRSALHSQGCMLVRMQPYNPALIVPDDLNSGALEAIRERAFSGPIAFVNKVLGNYAVLLESHRPTKRSIWGSVELCLLTSFFRRVKVDPILLQQILSNARKGRVKSIQAFIMVKLTHQEVNLKFSDFLVKDYLFFCSYCLKNPRELYRVFANYKKLKPLKDWLYLNTKSSFLENREYETCQ